MSQLTSTIGGVFPVIATPFDSAGKPDRDGLRAILRYVIEAGADGVVYPGVASEFDTLARDERAALTAVVAAATKGRVSFVAGGSAATAEEAIAIARQARALGAAALMVMAPNTMTTLPELRAFFERVADASAVPIMLQNAPPPIGAGLSVPLVLELIVAVPRIAYVKEEALPAGQRISQILARAPTTLKGVFGGAGGRYITDELARGAIGTMPACELTELHVELFSAHRRGDRTAVRQWFNRMLPLLNFQALFRMAMTKEVLRRRGIIEHPGKRAAGPELDVADQAELKEMLAELSDVLAPPVSR